ncbi:MAG: translocation and assembly module TamA [Paracoccaceae bacterium]|jgi:translocation and assembly module TamA
MTWPFPARFRCFAKDVSFRSFATKIKIDQRKSSLGANVRAAWQAIVAALVLGIAGSAAQAQEVRLNAPDASDELRAALRNASLTISLSRDDTGAASQDYVAAARADYQRLLTGLYAQGHYGGTISILIDGREAASIAPLDSPASVTAITLNVDPGPQFRFGRTEVAPLPAGLVLPEGFATGRPARSDVIRAAVLAGVDAWRDEGHAKAAPVAQQITARHGDAALDARVQIAPGPQLRFGPLIVSGAEGIRSERIVEIAGLPTGSVYSPAALARAQGRLRRVSALRSVAFSEGEIAAGDTLTITAQIVEQAPRRLGFGAEYSSVNGATLSGFWLHRNLLGGAEQFRVTGEISGLTGETAGIDYSLSASFLRPGTFRPDVDFYADAVIEQLDEPDYFLQQITAEAGLIRRIREEFTLEVGVGIRSGEVSDDLGDRRYTLLTFPIEATLDKRDDPLDAASGFYANAEITPFLGLRGSDNGARLNGDGRIYRSFGADDRVTFALRGQVGSLLGADAGDVPSDLLFFSGGGGTVRGQPYQSLNVDLGGGVEIGGSSFFGAQLESRVAVTDSIGIVGFYDVGYIGADAMPLQNGDWHAGAGLGLRYDTGIGPIRLDVAVPVGGDTGGSAVQIYLGIGQAF